MGRRTLVNKYLNLVFHIEVKTKSSYKILNLVVQFVKKKHEMALWVLSGS